MKTYIYEQKTGKFFLGQKLLDTGYSGAGVDKNRPESQCKKNKGPIPRGKWQITEILEESHLGAHSARLKPVNHTACGRSDFLVHADSVKSPGTASQGCIVLIYKVRLLLKIDDVINVI